MKIVNLKCEYLKNPLGIDKSTPRVSWQLSSTQQNMYQKYFQVVIASSIKNLKKNVFIWSSSKVQSPKQYCDIPPKICHKPQTQYYWKLRVWDQTNKESLWSRTAVWETGLMHTSNWVAEWLEAQSKAPVIHFKKEFFVNKKLKKARMYATAHGIYYVKINGNSISPALFRPGWTVYAKRIQYQTYDITKYVKKGNNSLEVEVGSGWWKGRIGTTGEKNVYGKYLGFLSQISLFDAYDNETKIITDETWLEKEGAYRTADFQEGEYYDANKENNLWYQAKTNKYTYKSVVSQIGYDVVKKEKCTPLSLQKTPSGKFIMDFGQNFAGIIKIKVQGKPNTRVELAFCETLDKNGDFFNGNLKTFLPAKNFTVTYVLKKSQKLQTFETKFSYVGFRYILIKKFPGKPSSTNFEAHAIYTNLPRTGDFVCSDKSVNKLYKNILWSQKSNFVDIPTDCPHRERTGWTGDSQVFASTAFYSMEIATFYNKWLADISAEQNANGNIPNIIPNPYKNFQSYFYSFLNNGSAGWADVSTTLPFLLYRVYDDMRFISDYYEMMKKWLNYCVEKYYSSSFFSRRFHWGEWMEPDEGKPFSVKFYLYLLRKLIKGDPELETAYIAYTASLVAKSAFLLNRKKDYKKYTLIHKGFKKNYQEKFVTGDNVFMTVKQAVYVRALVFDLLPHDLQKKCIRRLVDLIQKNDNHLNTGFLSTGHTLPLLTEKGYPALAQKILLQQSPPSWLYSVHTGSSTVWESWQGIDKSGKICGSHNHFALGSVGKFLFENLAGIKMEQQGYSVFTVSPFEGDVINSVKATFYSIYGKIKVKWKKEKNFIKLAVEVPPNTTAKVTTKIGRYFLRSEKKKQYIIIGSGKHVFFYYEK